MTDAERDALFFKHHKGRYAPGGCWENATRPMEGGTVTRQQASASRPHNGAVIENREPVKAEPITEPEVMPYCPPRMERIPGESKNAPDEAQAESWENFPEMEDLPQGEPVTAEMIFIDQRPAGRRY